MEQTAVEWFFEKVMITHPDNLDELLEQAKEMERDQKIAFGKRCFYEGFEKAENDDANCFTAWRESLDKLLTFK